MKKILTKSSDGQVDRVLLWISLGLLAFGLIMLTSASSVISFRTFGNSHHYIVRQLLLGALPGLILMYICAKVDYHVWQTLAPLLIFAGIGMLVAVLIPGIGFKVGGAQRWINFRVFLFQPTEFVKLAVIFYLASWYDKRQNHAQDFYYGFLPTAAIIGFVSLLIILEPDLGTMLVIVAIAASMFFLGGVRLRYLVSAAGAGLIALWVLIKAAPYRAQRLVAFFNPQVDATGISYQVNQGMLAIGSGGLWGAGYGQSRQKYNFLPEPIGDSIFAVVSEELGFVRVTILLLGFLLLAYKGYKIALGASDTFGKLVASGITSWLILQALINIGGIAGIIPLTGIPLPFISYGSSAMALNLAGVGILLNISKYSHSKT